jgi:hypothetical protein
VFVSKTRNILGRHALPGGRLAGLDATTESGDATSGGRTRWLQVVVPCAVAGILAVQAAIFVATTSATFDESVYLQLGQDAYQRHEFGGFSVYGVAPQPILLCYALPALSYVSDFAPAIILARVSAIALVGIPIVIVVYLWLLREAGPLPAAVGGALIAL